MFPEDHWNPCEWSGDISGLLLERRPESGVCRVVRRRGLRVEKHYREIARRAFPANTRTV